MKLCLWEISFSNGRNSLHLFSPQKSEEIFRVKLFELRLRRELELSIKSVHGQEWSVAPAAQEAEVGESEVWGQTGISNKNPY